MYDNDKMSDNYIVVICPHCEDPIIIYKNDINCRIFRHAVYKNTNKPINPHTSEIKCNLLVKSNKIFGCAKPFKLNEDDKAEICEYL